MSAPDTLMKTELRIPQETVAALAPKAQVSDLSFYYGDFKALKGISMPVYERKVTALIASGGFRLYAATEPGMPIASAPVVLAPGITLPSRPWIGVGQGRPARARVFRSFISARISGTRSGSRTGASPGWSTRSTGP